MDPDLSALDDFLSDAGHDGYLLHAGSDLADQYYLSGFDAPDPFVTLHTPETTALLVSGLEYGRAKNEARADAVRRHADYDMHAKAAEHGRREAFTRVLVAFLEEFGVDDVATNGRFPLGVADALREHDVALTADRDDHVGDARAVKTEAEVEAVRTAQRANEAAMRAAEDLLQEADADDGVLRYDGAPLTAERVKEEIEVTLLRHGCALDETIVACGADAAEPHNRGSGPLRADEPIVVDIFPRDKTSKYHADMTRTFVKGTPSDAAREFYELTQAAFDAAFDALEPGATGADVHAAACEVYEDAGYPTLRSDPGTETGYIHSTGHGVGLDVHEAPGLSDSSDVELEAGHVVTIEPGLYDPDVGGVRIEDIAVVTEDGYEDLTDYPVEWVVE
ncbi:aminopeptidase P family protein [Halarchaeum sp. CBA1220]|uniref:M24 family metallopeptidase n=1 Tax=Halarchaeum sp. CBA1220 TaxID=1853682 RepID=UPI000F3A8E7A|nr:Xaa-Pro peptidase family protein [Halarchaeum sp. CBA1220]QLC34583.1 aminopeptidase P family protein [Halarchaeum sp. CBA1220]